MRRHTCSSLKNQRLRTTATPGPPPSTLPKQFGSTKGQQLPSANGTAVQSKPVTGQKRKKLVLMWLVNSQVVLNFLFAGRGSTASAISAKTASFPTAYTFATNDEDEAR